MTGKRTILIAGMGTSPAVLAETEWALCHQKKSVVPDEGVVYFEPSVKFASGLRKAICYAVRSELRCLMPYLPSNGELLDEIERSRGRTVARKSAVKTKAGE